MPTDWSKWFDPELGEHMPTNREEGLELLVDMIVGLNSYNENSPQWAHMLASFETLGVEPAEVMEAQLRRITARFEAERSLVEQAEQAVR